MVFITLSTTFFLISPILTFPLISTTLDSRTDTTPSESWLVPTLNVHFRGNPPPKYNVSQFNSTIGFSIKISGEKIRCGVSFEEKNPPQGWNACDMDLGVEFELGPTEEAFDETHFVLGVKQLAIDGDFDELKGAQVITANNPGRGDSYLTCLGGAPLDGIRCKLGGMLSVRKELRIEVSESEGDDQE
ncbi:hypothetical protein P154DRAFT_524446 [Amniculicola lignicola CBS 123094]|uniref:Ubiquitin 3 binding protein But2 C-terminal domain-containing protein n=1 Tax=Amniculicola lignicola CBS 123094 TaxID=1392246 RepID=A0A6A5WJR0_9PLEO|nr:hypothetical protein P154DRAFT_524446 [Amniculicola lignicola CBS 123094]